MTRKILIAFALITLAITGNGSAQTATGIVVNGEQVTHADLLSLQRQLGVPLQAAIPPGNYWYDGISGLWGYDGGPAMGQISPGLRVGGQLSPWASGGGTGVFVNGRELHIAEVLYLQQIFGYVIPGRYWMNAAGIGGPEGGPATFNLAQAAAQAGGGSAGGYGGYTSRTPFGGTGGDGNCSYYLHPDGPSVMSC
jgi:hypothetical protein